MVYLLSVLLLVSCIRSSEVSATDNKDELRVLSWGISPIFNKEHEHEAHVKRVYDCMKRSSEIKFVRSFFKDRVIGRSELLFGHLIMCDRTERDIEAYRRSRALKSVVPSMAAPSPKLVPCMIDGVERLCRVKD